MYTTETYKKPFWAENSGFMTGRDPLGIENSSIATYARLLPGLTNLTSRLRYYGFYSWLLFEFERMEKSALQSSLEYHYNFIRRGELIIAYLMINKSSYEQGVIGSDYANKHKASIDDLGYYDIAKGADKVKDTPKGSVYWDYRSGALGQYYAGSLIALRLIETSNNFFLITEEGRRLATAFKERIPAQAQILFLHIIETGILHEDQFVELDYFSLGNIDPESFEWGYYKKLLLADDGESYTNSKGDIPSQRRETIFHYLSFLRENDSISLDVDFLKLHYRLNLQKPAIDASFGWYYFYINEMFHFSIETIFWGLLVELDGKIIPIKAFIDELCSAIVAEAKDDYLSQEDQTIIDLILDLKSNPAVDEIQLLVEKAKSPSLSIKSIVLAFKIVFQIYIENDKNRSEISKYEKTNFLIDKKGRTSEVIEKYIERHQEYSFKEYIRIFILDMINDHISTAYKKMGDGESNLLKFIIEDNMITHIQTMPPKFTSPRLKTLHSLLTDLRLIENKNRISKLGVKFLEEFNS
jgi:hypothetical protein